VAASRVGSATDRDSLSTRHADGSPVLVEEDAAAMAELLLTRLVAQVDKVVDGLLFRQEIEQAQELPHGVDAARGSQTDRQQRNLAVLDIIAAILPDLLNDQESGRFLEDSIGLVRMTQTPMATTIVASSTDEIMALGDIEQQSPLLREADGENLRLDADPHW
jgi:hypothetical protein